METTEEIETSVNTTINQYCENPSKLMQIATDCTRILSTTIDDLSRVKESGFFTRIKNLVTQRYSPDVVVQNTTTYISEVSKEDFETMKAFAAKGLEALNERNLLTADALITVENNLKTLVVTEKETREIVTKMMVKVADRFEKLENKVSNLEDSQRLNTWIDGIEVEDYYESLPETIRFLKIVKDYYTRKKSNYSRDELLLLKKAIRNSGIDFKKQISLGDITDSLIEELESFDENEYQQITKVMLDEGDALSSKEISQIISIPSFVSIVELPESKHSLESTVRLLQKTNAMNGSTLSYVEALKLAVKNDIAERNNIDMEIKMSLSDLGIELISCYSALPNLVAEYKSASPKPLERTIKSKYCMICGKPLIPGKKFCMECGTEIVNN